jgi:hypothetical protein
MKRPGRDAGGGSWWPHEGGEADREEEGGRKELSRPEKKSNKQMPDEQIDKK